MNVMVSMVMPKVAISQSITMVDMMVRMIVIKLFDKG